MQNQLKDVIEKERDTLAETMLDLNNDGYDWDKKHIIENIEAYNHRILTAIRSEIEEMKKPDPTDNKHHTWDGGKWNNCEACKEDYNWNTALTHVQELINGALKD